MLFKKHHSFVIEKPIHIVRVALKSSTDKINITELSETKLHALMKNKYVSGFNVISDIHLTAISSNKTSIKIKNKFDLYTNLFLIVTFIVLWGISIHQLINGAEILSFELIIKLAFPIIGALITKFSFEIYDRRVLKIYTALLNAEVPN